MGIDRKNVSTMFNSIAPTYDRLNHILSFGRDRVWRRRATRILKRSLKDRPATASICTLADFATGTGDFAIQLARSVKACHILALDFSEGMLAVCKKKVGKKHLSDSITIQQENCQNTSLDTESVFGVTCAFGIRNFQDPMEGLREMLRILKPGYPALILEFARPRNGLIAGIVKWYYAKGIPFLGRIISGNRGAYSYLPATIYEFPCGEEFCSMMSQAGFERVGFKSLNFNLVNLYWGYKCC